MFRKTWWSGIILAVALVMPALAGRSGLSAGEKALEKYLKAESANSATIAAFDHVQQTWSILDWDGSRLKKTEGPEEDPDIALRGAQQLRVFVVNTNPLVFTADRSSTASTTIDALENLKTLASGLGGIASVSLGVGAQAKLENLISERNQNLTKVKPTDSQTFALHLKNNEIRAAEKMANVPSTEILDLSTNFITELNKTTKDIDQTPIKDLKKASDALKTQLEEIPESQPLGWLQSVESGVPVASRLTAPDEIDLSKLGKAFAGVEKKRKELEELELPCEETVSTVADLVLIKRTPLVGLGAAKAQDDFDQTARKVSGGMAEDHCSPALQQATTNLVNWLIVNPPTASGPTGQVEVEALRALTEGIAPYVELSSQVAEADDKATQIAMKQPAAILSASQVKLFLTRLKDSTAGSKCKHCDPAKGVIEIKRASFSGSDLSWAEVRTDTVTISVDEGLKDKLTLSHPATAEGSFSAHRKWTDGLEADFGLTKTDLSASTFTAVMVKDDGSGITSKIQETDRTTRSGKAALFASYRWPLLWGFAIGPQIGAGTDTDVAALFYGVSLRWRFISFGYGRTRQKVPELNGQEVGQGLRDGETVKTRDTFQTRPYLSFTLTIKNLNFFKPAS